jgi:hypothetical protein
MLVASDFILNGRCGVRNGGENDVTTTTTSSQLQFAISPWLAETKNVTDHPPDSAVGKSI